MNKSMFGVGIAMIAIAAITLIFVEEDLGISPMVLAIIGILFIGISKYRPMKEKTNNIWIIVVLGLIAFAIILFTVLI